MAEQGRIDDAIAESTLHLLRSGGPRAVTVEAVAAHSGIAKTTIYRRYRDRRDMLSSSLMRLASPAPLDTQAEPRERLRWLIEHAVEMIEHGIGLGGLAATLTEDDPEFSTLFQQMIFDRRRKLAAAIETAKTEGSMRDDIDTATLIDAMVGAYVVEYARTGEIADGWEERLFDLFWPVVRGQCHARE